MTSIKCFNRLNCGIRNIFTFASAAHRSVNDVWRHQCNGQDDSNNLLERDFIAKAQRATKNRGSVEFH